MKRLAFYKEIGHNSIFRYTIQSIFLYFNKERNENSNIQSWEFNETQWRLTNILTITFLDTIFSNRYEISIDFSSTFTKKIEDEKEVTKSKQGSNPIIRDWICREIASTNQMTSSADDTTCPRQNESDGIR